MVPVDTPPVSPCQEEEEEEEEEVVEVAVKAEDDAKEEKEEEEEEEVEGKQTPDPGMPASNSLVDLASEKVTDLRGKLSGALGYLTGGGGPKTERAEEAKEEEAATEGEEGGKSGRSEEEEEEEDQEEDPAPSFSNLSATALEDFRCVPKKKIFFFGDINIDMHDKLHHTSTLATLSEKDTTDFFSAGLFTARRKMSKE